MHAGPSWRILKNALDKAQSPLYAELVDSIATFQRDSAGQILNTLVCVNVSKKVLVPLTGVLLKNENRIYDGEDSCPSSPRWPSYVR